MALHLDRMNSMKKFLTALLILSLVISQSIPAFAKDNTTFDDLKAKYGLELVNPEDMPKGIMPVEINSFAELKNHLKDVNIIKGNFSIKPEKDDNGISPEGLWPEVTQTDSRTISEFWPLYKLISEVKYRYQWDDSNSERIFNGVTSTSRYMDYSINFVYEEEQFSATISSDHRTLTVNMLGNLVEYITYEGNTWRHVHGRVDLSYDI